MNTDIEGEDVLSLNEDVLSLKLADLLTPGFVAEFDPDQAEKAGAFQEDALSEADAMSSNPDLVEL